MKPDWDKLMDEYKDSETQLIADADCTADGKPLCDANGVKGFPTLKFGDPNDLQDYQGARSYDALKKFIDTELKPTCGPANLDLCDDEKKKEIADLMALDDDTLDAKIATEQKKIEEAESVFKAGVEELQASYQKLMQDKEETEAAVKASGLGLMKSVKVVKKKAAASGSDELWGDRSETTYGMSNDDIFRSAISLLLSVGVVVRSRAGAWPVGDIYNIGKKSTRSRKFCEKYLVD